MKNLFYCCIAICAIAFLQSCSDQETKDEDIQTESGISTVRCPQCVPTFGDDNNLGPACTFSECAGNWLPADYAFLQYGFNSDECEMCVWVDAPEGVTGDLCVSLTDVDNLDDDLNETLGNLNISQTVTAGEQLCFSLDFSASFGLTIYFMTEDGCAITQVERDFLICTDCCDGDDASISFIEIDTDNLYKTFCGTILTTLDTECEGPFTWEYSAEPGTGLKGGDSGTGTSFYIDAQNDCGLLGPGHYTVTFSDGDCFEHTDTYYFEPCNTDLYSPGNPAAMQMDYLNVFCSGGVRLTSATVAKCCSCIGEGVKIIVLNGNGDEREFEGGVLMEAGCQPASSWFKKEIPYDPADWTACCNIIEVYDCEGNLIHTEEDVDDPDCDD